MNETFTFAVTPRTVVGKKASQLRKNNQLPGNIYGVGKDSVSIQFDVSEFQRLYRNAGETSVIYLKIGSDSQQKPVLIDEIQGNPLTGELLHVSFKQVDLTQTIEAEIPVEIVGEFKVSGGVLVTVKDAILVEALPTDLPEKFEINAELLTEVGQIIALSDLNFDKNKVTLVGVESDEELSQPVVMVQELQEEEETEETSPADVEVTGESKETTPESETKGE